MTKSRLSSLAIAALLTLNSCGQPPPPATEDPQLTARINEAWDAVSEHAKRLQNGEATQADDPQPRYAKEFFDYFLNNIQTTAGKKAGETAFMMWANLGAADDLERAISKIPRESNIWREILNSIGNTYYRSKRNADYFALINRLEDELTDPGSRSELKLRIAHYAATQKDPRRAKACLEEVVALGAHPYDVQKAQGELYEMDYLNVGQAAPDFSAETIDGHAFVLSDFRGKVVVLEFWATWCGPCLPEIDHLAALEKQLAGSDFQIIGVSKDNDLNALRRFLAERALTWPQVQQLAEFNGDVLQQDSILNLYNVFGIPRSFLIDHDGMLVAKDLRGEELQAEVRELLMRTRPVASPRRF